MDKVCDAVDRCRYCLYSGETFESTYLLSCFVGLYRSSLEAFLRSGGPSWRALTVLLGKFSRLFRVSRALCRPRSPQEVPKELPRAPRDDPRDQKRPQNAAEKVPRDFYWGPRGHQNECKRDVTVKMIKSSILTTLSSEMLGLAGLKSLKFGHFE